jgi:hypothetical protein
LRSQKEPTVTNHPLIEIDQKDRERARAIIQKHVTDGACACPDCQAAAENAIAEALSQVRQESQQEIASLKAEMRRMYSRVEYNSARAEIEELGERAEATEARLRDPEGRTDDGPQPPQ